MISIGYWCNHFNLLVPRKSHFHIKKNCVQALLLTLHKSRCTPDSKVHGANMGPTWVLSAPDGPHVGPMNLAIMVVSLLAWCTLTDPNRRMILRSYFTDKMYYPNIFCEKKVNALQKKNLCMYVHTYAYTHMWHIKWSYPSGKQTGVKVYRALSLRKTNPPISNKPLIQWLCVPFL